MCSSVRSYIGDHIIASGSSIFVLYRADACNNDMTTWLQGTELFIISLRVGHITTVCVSPVAYDYSLHECSIRL